MVSMVGRQPIKSAFHFERRQIFLNPVLVRINGDDHILRSESEVSTLVSNFLTNQKYQHQLTIHSLTGYCELKKNKSCHSSKQICARKDDIRFCKNKLSCDYKTPFFNIDGLMTEVFC